MLPCHPSALKAIQSLRQRFPDAPFLTLGQTVLWDEPVKAAFCRIVERLVAENKLEPGARIVAGVHDTDYFAKLPAVGLKAVPFAVLRHNDGDTRGLWSAAGELSALFGAEIVPSRHNLTQNNVAFDRAARVYPGGAEGILNQETDAPLWRAIVHTEPHALIAADVRLSDIAPALREQLLWGFRHSLRALGCSPELDSPDLEGADPCQSRDIARRILGWVDEFIALFPDATLSALYRDLIPKLWALVRGREACSLETTASMELFRFNRQTCSLPRFGFVGLFLNPKTRDLARKSYDDAVRGSGIYTLDQFGEGALPFDVVIPGQGRGTLRLHQGSLYIETETPVTLCAGCDCSSLGELAAVLEETFGPDVALVGKAVALISMLGAEFIFVFHEKASSYTSRTQKMNAALREGGVALDLKPMLRLQYETWDALAGVEAKFVLPEPLAGAFGQAEIAASDFAARWKEVCAKQDKARQELAACRSPRALMERLAQNDAIWPEKLQALVGARGAVLMVREVTQEMETAIADLRAEAQGATRAALEVEAQKSAHFHAEIAPLQRGISDIREKADRRLAENSARKLSKDDRAELAQLEATEMEKIALLRQKIAEKGAERAEFDQKIEEFRALSRNFKAHAAEHVADKAVLEKSGPIQTARHLAARLEGEAELERLRRVRDALVVSGGLRQNNVRPTAWWLPLVSPDGKWFDQIAQTAQARVEEL